MKTTVCIIAFLLLASLSAFATSWTVNIQNFTFSPTPLNIGLNDTVHWVWVGGTHSTTSDSGQTEAWDSGLKGAGATFDHVFTHMGSFQYYCTLHGGQGGQGMSAIVSVVPEPAGLMAVLAGVLGVGAQMLWRRERRD